ncbi:MAG TPA: universal stress protein [Candidatus Acidoferrum sp.]|nr:universal stress protein [Candidatus Acidoferrum sp.]
MSSIQTGKRIALKNILFLTDFSDSSAAAAPFASSIARAYGSVLHVLHVLMPSPFTYMAPEAAVALMDSEEDRAKEEMRRVEAQFSGLPSETAIERGGSVWPVLSDVLQRQEFDLIVLGTHGRTGMQKLLLGSSAEEVFRRAHVPVLTIGPSVHVGAHSGGRFRCVLFATDFNAVSTAAAPYAVSLAQENQSRLVLLHVHRKPKSGKSDRENEQSIAESLHQLHELVPAEAELWCRPEAMVRHGDAAREILAAADDCRADLIVLGVRGMERLAAAAARLDRGITYQVVVNARCPVLTVRG